MFTAAHSRRFDVSASTLLELLFWGALMGLWGMTIWGGWAERHYERVGNQSWSWFWLRKRGVAPTKEQCVRFSKAVSLFGMIAITLALAIALLLGDAVLE